MAFAVNIADVRDAAERLAGVAAVTPLLENPTLNARAGRRVLLKFEGAQLTGSFKFRGAYNRLVRLAAEEREAGVVAWSSGNHAQGVAAAAQRLGIPATIVMPADAPAIKQDNTRRLGARIVSYDRWTESREEIAMRLAAQRGAVIVPSFDDPHVIAGQGTIGLELLNQTMALGCAIGEVIVPCGGGGLIGGIATAVKAQVPDARFYSAEPQGFDDMARSLAAGHRVANEPGGDSLCDALLTPSPGLLTFPIAQSVIERGLAVSDAQVCEAVRFAFGVLKLVVEPGGAAALAALLSGLVPAGPEPARGPSVTVIVLSGSNVDPALYAAILRGEHPSSREN